MPRPSSSLSENPGFEPLYSRSAGGRALEQLKRNPERLLILLLVGNNAAKIGAAAVATHTAAEVLGSAGVGLATGVMTLLVLFVGEIAPKRFAARNADRLSLLAAPFLRAWGPCSCRSSSRSNGSRDGCCPTPAAGRT